MRRFLIVGCGGSGGATLAYMMDQLRSELGAHGLPLPAGWQFVHIDVPVTPDKPPSNIGSVADQGGTYVACGPAGASYEPLDTTVTSRPRILDELATWAPGKPSSVTVPINVGAGQFRAVGRMITLSRADELRQKLAAAWSNLARLETIQELTQLEQTVTGSASPDSEPPVVLVVSSMAGGSGASMALDVCRLLSEVSGTRLISVFMFSADVFNALKTDQRTGVRGNSLAMTGEIIAAQSGAGRAHDQAVLRVLGLAAGEGVTPPFARVFPVSQRVGLEQTPFGDGSPEDVYRGLARGLAGLMMSTQASSDFVSYDLGNTGGTAAAKDVFGWGLDNEAWDPMPWGSFGYASLSTGRERFGEYSAQRIARGAVDRLVSGHLARLSTASSVEQLKALLDSQWEAACRDIGLPTTSAEFPTWVAREVFADADAEAHRILQSDVVPYLSPPTGQNGAGFLTTVRGQLNQQRGRLVSSADSAAYGRMFTWHRELADRLVRVVSAGVARHGLPYGIALVDRIETHLREVVVREAVERSRAANADVAAVPRDSETAIGAIRGVIANGQQLMSSLIDNLRYPLRTTLLTSGCSLIAETGPALVAEVLGPLRTTLTDALAYLEVATGSAAADVGLARLQTNHYAAWPSDDDQHVSARFMHALNDILLIKSSEFDEEFRRQLVASVQTPQSGRDSLLNQSAHYGQARDTVVGQVIAGDWPSTGSGTQPQRDLLTQAGEWRTRVFGRDPQTGQTTVPQAARFELRTRPAEVLDRARRYVHRPDESFDVFVRASLRELVESKSVSDVERDAMHAELVRAFGEALGRARPMISVNTEAANRIHGPGSARYRYKFSEVPFLNLSIASDFADRLRENPNIDDESVSIFDRALRGVDSTVSRIDVFGSYANLSPVVFDSVLSPAAEEWAAMQPAGRAGYWRWRRARPLRAALPFGDIERRAMIAGWFVGQITGELRFAAPPFDDDTAPAEVWDAAEDRWRAFPDPMLTPPKCFIAEYDWLPAVLESGLVALAAAADPPLFASMRPYQLLRGLYDDSSQAPLNGPLTQVSGQRRISRWLSTGLTSSAEPSRVAKAAEASTPQERADAVVEWLVAINGLAGSEYCAPGEGGAPGGGMFSQITDRKQARRTPLFRDIAADVYAVTADLQQLVGKALSQALTARAPDVADGADGAHPWVPDIGMSF